MIATTIRKIYFDQIVAGTRKIEYREYNDFWKKKIEGKRHGAILFLSGRRCKAFHIVNIEVITTPEDIFGIIGTVKCFAIHLGGCVPVAEAGGDVWR